ncbi:hypothetical protein E4T39_03123 [Aureobasidium subglaciale]|nr:hypothetical protein E4T39_03123 [Aureobasidium subglaciale]
MSDYGAYDDRRRYRETRTRPRDRGDPEFVQETTYIERGKGPPPRDLVYRPREESVEDIARDFPPPSSDRYAPRGGRREYDNYPPPRRARSQVGRRNYDDYDDDYDVPVAAAAAAGAGYAAGRAKDRRRHRDRHDRDYDSEEYSPPRRRHAERRKSGVGEILEGLGLGGVAAAITGRSRSRSRSKDRDSRRDRDRDGRAKSRHGGRYDSDEYSRSRSRSKGRTERKWAQAAQAALVAGAVEAFRSRKDPGPWTGEKARRIATAAIGAGGIDGLVDRNPDKKTKRHLVEAVVGGLATTRLANGPRSKSRGPAGARDDPYGRSRSRSRSIFGGRGRSQSRGRDGQGGGGGGGLEKLAAGGALAAAGKAIYDRVRSKSRRRRSPSSSSADSYVPSRNRRRDKELRSPAQSDTGSRAVAQRGRDRNVAPAAAAGAGAGALAASTNNRGARSQSSSSSSTDVDVRRKRMRGKELLTAGLATVATIHAAHGVYSSMEAHERRHKLVQEGEMSPAEARKKQTKAWVQDAAAVGIAALGIKGAFSEWKEMNEHRREIHELEKRKALKERRREKQEKEARRAQEDRLYQMLPLLQQQQQPVAPQMYGQPGTQMMYPSNIPPPPPGPPPGARY